MDKRYTEVCEYRINESSRNYKAAQLLFIEEDYLSALNRAYYSVFHIMNALLGLDDFNFNSHAAVIAKFRELYIKTGIFNKNFSKFIGDLFEYRNNSDYTDLFYATKEETEIQIENAKIFCETVKPYIEKRIKEING